MSYLGTFSIFPLRSSLHLSVISFASVLTEKIETALKLHHYRALQFRQNSNGRLI